MKILRLALLTFLISALSAYGQKTQEVSARQKQSFMSNPQAKKLLDNFKAKGFTSTALVPEGTKTFTGKDASGDVNVSLITYTLTDKNKKTTDVVVFTNNATGESKVWAENEKEVFTVTGKTIAATAQRTGPAANAANARSAGDCFKTYGKGAIQSCSSCVSCVNGCWSKNKKWKRIACAVGNCSGSCWSCITNVYNFVVCIFD